MGINSASGNYYIHVIIDMISDIAMLLNSTLQVYDVDKKFADLERLKKDNWVHEESIIPPKKTQKKRKAVTTPRGLKSNIRAHITATRQKQYMPK